MNKALMKVQHRKVKMLSLASPGVSESEACVSDDGWKILGFASKFEL